MAFFYKGVANGTYWHIHDAQKIGLAARAPQAPDSLDRLMNHIARAQTVSSPFISLTLSYSVAWAYAVVGRTLKGSITRGVIYEIELAEPLPKGVSIIDSRCESRR